VDAPSRGIPYLVISTGIATAEALTRTGQNAAADSLLGVSRQLAIAMRFGDIAGQLPEPLPMPSGDSLRTTPVPVRPPNP
jgi:hypothetical protein